MAWIVQAGIALAALAFLWPILSNAVYRHFLRALTGVTEAEAAALPRRGPKIKGTAVVAGGSFAGLMSARVLSTHFERVVLFEAEELPARKHVPQALHIHAFLPFAYMVLQKLFPADILASAVEQFGGRPGTSVPNFCLYGGFMQGIREKLSPTITLTRYSLETLVRKLVLENTKGLDSRRGTVTGFRLSTDRTQVATVEFRSATGEVQHLDADFLVDATGAVCSGTNWLKAQGIRAPAKITYHPNIHYRTLNIKATESLKKLTFPNGVRWNNGDVTALFANIADASIGKAQGTYWQHSENDGLVLTISGMGKHPPFQIDTVEDLIDHAALDYPPFGPVGHELIEAARERGEEPACLKLFLPACFRLNYQTVSAGLPQNFVAVGDSRCVINPIYGQGVSKSFIDAMVLDSMLREHSHLKVATPFFKAQAGKIDGLLDTTKGGDYAYTKSTVPTEGETLDWGHGLRAFIKRYAQAAHKDAELGTRFWRVNALLEPPTTLFAPAALLRLGLHFVTNFFSKA